MNELRGLWRGKRVDNGEWVEGLLTDRCSEEGFAVIQSSDYWEHDVAPSTLGECTGLTDKNGKFVFEGDIITNDNNHFFCIEWSESIASFVSRSLDGMNMLPCTNVGTMNNYEVIGNIHDNPELLPAHEEDGESNAR